MRPTLPVWLSFNGGYVDTAGYLALQGLFTAHVTGNFVTFGAAMANGTSGAIAKLLALPVFCVVVMATRIVSQRLPALGLPMLNTMLLLKVALLAVGAACAIGWGRSATVTLGGPSSPAWCWWPRWQSKTRCTASISARPRLPP